MRQHKQGIRSMKVVNEDELFNFKPTPGVKHKEVFLHVLNATKEASYTDQTGCFLVISACENKYLMVVVKLDGNYIDAKPMQERAAKEFICAYQTIYQQWKATGSFAQVGIFSTTKHLKSLNKQFMRMDEELN